MSESIGTAGEDHIDREDQPGYYTHVISASELPYGSDPGRFFVLYPGVYVTNSLFSSCCFSGLFYHGSSPAIAPAGTSEWAMNWGVRLSLVSYPPVMMGSEGQRRPLCALVKPDIFWSTPEMTTIRYSLNFNVHIQYLHQFSARCLNV